MKKGLTTANAIIIAVIVIGSIFAINLLNSLSGVGDISGNVISKIGGFCGERMVWSRKVAYTCPSGSSCVNSRCVKVVEAEPKEITESQVPAGATLILGEMSDRLWTLNVGDSVVVEGKKVTLTEVGSTGAIGVIVDGVKEVIAASTTETVNGLTITNKEVFYTLIPPKVIEIPKEITVPSVGLTEAQKQEVLWMLNGCLATGFSSLGGLEQSSGTTCNTICKRANRVCIGGTFEEYRKENGKRYTAYTGTLPSCNYQMYGPNFGGTEVTYTCVCCSP